MLKAIEIKPDVFWVGGIDWNERNFHGYTTERGSTYNAYLILDEKITLIDTCKKPFTGELIERIGTIVDPASIDYIVSNHVEMDHSGGLPALAEIAPKATIVTGAPKGIQGLRAHYGDGLNLVGVKTGDTLAFAHGFNVHYGYITPPEDVNVIMCAPKGPGHIVRRQYTEGSGVPDLICVAQDATGDAWDIALSYAWGVGGARAGVIKATFAQETEEDLFGEQAVLCGGLVELVKAGFETLVDAGYPPELAYFECYHEMKMIVDLMYESGIHFMNYSISNTAEYGEYYAGPKVINEQSREAMREILARIQDGTFAEEFVADCKNGHAWLIEQREAINSHEIEKTGERIRGMFSWIHE